MEKKVLILFIVFGLAMVLLTFNALDRAQKRRTCYVQSAEIWNSVNTDFPEQMSQQQAFDKSTRQACAAFRYAACMNNETVACSLDK